MEGRAAARRQTKLLHHKDYSAEDEEDRISDLPDTIVHRIFGCLPFEDVAKTCVLSKRWKHLWYSYPCLDFSSVFNKSKYMYGSDQATDCIGHVVRLLEKHSDVKILRYRGFVGPAFDPVGLMEKSIEHSVQELDIEFSSRHSDSSSFTVPHCIANSSSLRDLRLMSRFNNPQFALPPLEVMKNGFKSLQSLSLSRVNLTDEPLRLNLFTGSSFPSLTNLCLKSCSGLKFLRIQLPGLRELALQDPHEMQELDVSAEKLEKLSVEGCFDDCRVRTRVKIDAPSLKHLIWSLNAVTDEFAVGTLDSLKEAVVGGDDFRSDRKMRSVSSFLTAISRCQCLTLERRFIRILSRFNDSAGFRLPVFERLRSLKVDTCLDEEDAPGLARLFRSSPFVDTICISIEEGNRWYHEQGKDHWESQAQSLDSFLGHLRFVKVLGCGDKTSDGGLVRFLLKHVRDLRRFSVSNVGYSVMADVVKSQLVFE